MAHSEDCRVSGECGHDAGVCASSREVGSAAQQCLPAHGEEKAVQMSVHSSFFSIPQSSVSAFYIGFYKFLAIYISSFLSYRFYCCCE